MIGWFHVKQNGAAVRTAGWSTRGNATPADHNVGASSSVSCDLRRDSPNVQLGHDAWNTGNLLLVVDHTWVQL